ncbi:DUF4124 domain-containing protein [Pseudomonas sp. GD03944]|uniref:DUF4124 domain-containing protein n=1 Tax=Pseudomonas sp. GD03944 TaxID=2975409 RepID=UPI002449D99C|nr:DUF4124 domain-containing protein [Pseudomonas sp. GD03944]MDH1261809.1 DUF4124 domain-containing protein [Pseudomonas sp. GD03944]
MHGLQCAAFVCIISLYPTTSLSAATVFRCEDANGHITFTFHGCPTDQQQQLQDARNHTPSSGETIPLADTSRPEGARQQPRERLTSLTVVGERTDGCGDVLTGHARRDAMVKRQVRSGMTQSDVESMFGKPDRVSSRNGETRWHFLDPKGNTRQVSFDEAGCVKN